MSVQVKHFRVVGISHRNSPIELREKLSFHEATAKQFLKNLREVHGITEALLVSTCNRTELYFTSSQLSDAEIEAILCFNKGIDHEAVKSFFTHLSDEEAVRHLFKVSLGLDAKVLGDIQIINQVKTAYQWAADEGIAGPILHRMMHTIFFVNKRIIQETNFRDGSGSVASVAVSLIKSQAEVITDPRILLIGTGEIGQNVFENLNGEFSDVTIVNRTRERAENLAQPLGFRIADFENLFSEISKADVIVSALSVEEVLISESDVQASMTPKLFIDLSVPRSISETIENVQGAVLYNVDQIEEKASKVLKQRERAKKEVERIMEEQLSEFHEWVDEMAVSPTIQQLKERLEVIRKEEIARHIKNLSDGELELIDSVTKNIIQKVIKLPVLELKAACKRGEAETLVDALNDIFNLEKSPTKKS